MNYGLGMIIKCLILLAFTSNQLWAGAFSNNDLTASGAGVANASVASADDIAAAIYNPAGLAWQDGVQALIGNHSRYRSLSVNRNGQSEKGDANLTDLSHFAMSWKPYASDWGGSVSVVTPFAARTNWSGAFTAPATALGEMNLHIQRYSADVYWRISNALALSLGTDWYDGSMILESGGNTFSGSQQGGLGGHIGLRWQVHPFWTVGAHYRQASPLTFDDGNNGKLRLNLPDVLSVAVMHDIGDSVRLEMDIKHTGWSGLGNLDVLRNNITTQSLVVGFSDTTDVLIGATWFWRDDTQLRFGYAYEQSANSTVGLQPAIVDLPGHRISVGFGGMMSGMHLDVAWSGVIYQASAATGEWAGTYSDSRNSLMFSLSKLF